MPPGFVFWKNCEAADLRHGKGNSSRWRNMIFGVPLWERVHAFGRGVVD
jgi:hypothetical protein